MPRRTTAILTTAALLASLTAATLATPASAAKPKCAGKAATIVGSAGGEVIHGTAKDDVIVARGGHDLIDGRGGHDTVCGGSGNDRLFGGPGNDLLLGQTGRDRHAGGPGRDRLLGGPHDDSLNGGTGNDACLQGTGTGPSVNCERPVVVPPPPPEPPEPPTLVVAYSDVNTNHVFDAGDVLISKIVDTNRDTKISAGDTIKMGQYPTSPFVIAPARIVSPFEDWKVKSHTLTSGDLDASADWVQVQNAAGWNFRWIRRGSTPYDGYSETLAGPVSRIVDWEGPAQTDSVELYVTSVSQPTSAIDREADGLGDDGFIDVEIYVS